MQGQMNNSSPFSPLLIGDGQKRLQNLNHFSPLLMRVRFGFDAQLKFAHYPINLGNPTNVFRYAASPHQSGVSLIATITKWFRKR